MRRLWWLAVFLAACASNVQEPVSGDLHVYAFAYPAGGALASGTDGGLGWLFQVRNDGPDAAVTGCTTGLEHVTLGPTRDGWQATVGRHTRMQGAPATCGEPFDLATGESVAFLVKAHGIKGDTSMRFLVDGQTGYVRPMAGRIVSGAPVMPGMHVQTATVGVWENGTAFYTNIPHLLQDPAYPAAMGLNRTEALLGAAPLPIFVYEATRAEQPPASRDTCHFTTINGYNALLRTQGEGGTAVRYLQPQEAYTLAGNEAHALYGDALVFLNTVLAIDGATTVAHAAPEPNGACYDVQHTLDYYGVNGPLSSMRLGPVNWMAT